MFDVITIGAATRDVFLRSKAWEIKEDPKSPTGFNQCLPLGAKVPVDDILFTTGGGATNAAVTFARMGRHRVATVCRIGAKDSGGHAVLEDLRRERVATTFVQQDRARHTAYSLILLAGSGERTILVHRGAAEHLEATRIPWRQLRTRWFSVTSLGGNLALFRKILAHARRTGAKVAWNPGSGELAAGWDIVAPLARQVDVFNLNREEAASVTGLEVKNLQGVLTTLCGACGIGRPTRGFILVTDGARGAYACDGCTVWFLPGRKVKAVNTTGAGDAFGSAFVLGIIRGFTPPDALRLAMANAEGVITHMGAKAGILRRMPSRVVLARYELKHWQEYV